MRLLPLLLFCFAVWADESKEKTKLPGGRSDLERGEKLYQGHCALCHGTGGDGGRGPSLLRRRLTRAPDDTALVKVIEEGINGTEMPGASQMSPREHRQVAAYVRSLSRVPATPVPGDPKRGEQLYLGKGECAGCHAINGKGGTLGPELSDVGDRRSSAYLRASITDPEADVPRSFLQVRVVAKSGRTITGERLNEDSFSIQLRDYSGNLHSFLKQDLAEIHRDRGKSPMPSYKDKFTGTELDDLIAYLVSLREAK